MKQFATLLFSIFLFQPAFSQEAIEVEKKILLGKDTLRGTLLSAVPLKSKKIKNKPLIIIIPGSGPTDRNGNSTMLPGPNDSYKQLADSLIARGISSFRYDKMGVGASTTSKSESEMRFYDNVEAVKVIYDSLRDVGFRNIYLIGHSEGSLVGMLAAQELKVKGFISVAGPGSSFYDILVTQLTRQLSGEMLKQTINKIDSVKQGFTVTSYSPFLASLLRESVQPYLRSAFGYNPQAEIRKVNVPVLIIQGGQDVQVTKDDSEKLTAAMPDALYLYYPDMNHVLKMTDGSEEQNRASYFDPDFPLNPRLAHDISQWISEH